MLENKQVRRSFFSVLFMPYNKSFIDQANSVKMAGYWPRSLFTFLWTSTSSRSIKTQKENSANIQPSWPRAWSIIYTYRRVPWFRFSSSSVYSLLFYFWPKDRGFLWPWRWSPQRGTPISYRSQILVRIRLNPFLEKFMEIFGIDDGKATTTPLEIWLVE